MKNNRRIKYLKNILIPCLFLSGVAGIFTGALIFCFKAAAGFVIDLSGEIYAMARTMPRYILPLILGAAAAGALACLMLHISPGSKGGGIPSAIIVLRGLVPFSWIKNIVFLFSSAMLTFFAGVPLGNEGPSVKMGCAVGKGTVNLLARKNKAWERYIMTGGACGGFAAATGAPLSGMLFAFEEVHRRFSPIIFMAVSMATIASSATMEMLCHTFGMHSSLFELTDHPVLPIKFIWIALIVGLLCGGISILFTKGYNVADRLVNHALEKVPFLVKMISVFVITAVLGVISAGFIGSGHSLVDEIFYGDAGAWYLLLIYLLIRAIMLLLANNVGVTGGTFIPVLTFGAIIGSLCATAFTSVGILSEEYSPLIVCIGMASFLAASSRVPLTAIAFSLEALACMTNILPLTLAVGVAFFIIEMRGMISFNDTVIEHKLHNARKGKTSRTLDIHMTVKEDAFVVGKEVYDILWPPSCIVLSIKKAEANSVGMGVGDVLHLKFTTFDADETKDLLEALIGDQGVDKNAPDDLVDDDSYEVPET